MQPPTNPLIDDRDVELIFDEVLDVPRLFRLPYFAEHDRETVAMFIGAARDLARDVASRDAGYYQAKLAAAQYWLFTELPRIDHLATLCRDAEDSYAQLDPDWL
jgi:hypothetical protein